jgi:hypothetical protein
LLAPDKCQKRPTQVSKETYTSVKRDLHKCQKRPTQVSKETYTSVKSIVYCIVFTSIVDLLPFRRDKAGGCVYMMVRVYDGARI